MMKKNKLIAVSGLLISSFSSDASQKSIDTLPAKIENDFENSDISNFNLVSNRTIDTMSFVAIDHRSFSDRISELKKLPTEIKFYKKLDDDDNQFGQSLELSQELKDKYITFVQNSYHYALEAGLLIKQNIGFKEVVLYVDLDDEGQIDRMIAEFVHESKLTSSFVKEFE